MTNKMCEKTAISAIGFFLAEYYSDLEYIEYYHKYQSKLIDEDVYLDVRQRGGFKKFVNSYKVARNFKGDEVGRLLNELCYWDDKKYCDVNGFALNLRNKDITHPNKTMLSLASKLLFLRFPDKVIPIDSLNRKGLNITYIEYGDYTAFNNKITESINQFKSEILQYLDSISSYLKKIEAHFDDLDINIEEYRIKRFADKYYWVMGKF